MKQPMIILIGPSGVGKSSFLERAIKEFPNLFDTTTYTTRKMRKGESEGRPYHFIDREKFKSLIDKNYFVEFAEVHGNLYGTPYDQIENAFKNRKIVIMDVDVQGARTFKAKFPGAVTVFLRPPSIDSLRQRILKREGKAPADLELRLANAEREMKEAAQFEIEIVNDDFEIAYLSLKKLIEDLSQSL
jgi:guanylate kinase